MNAQINALRMMMDSKIAAIAGMNVETNVLAGNANRGMIITIIIDGNEAETTAAANRIAAVAGSKFENGGYDAELEAYFCGINE